MASNIRGVKFVYIVYLCHDICTHRNSYNTSLKDTFNNTKNIYFYNTNVISHPRLQFKGVQQVFYG